MKTYKITYALTCWNDDLEVQAKTKAEAEKKFWKLQKEKDLNAMEGDTDGYQLWEVEEVDEIGHVKEAQEEWIKPCLRPVDQGN